jgi:hypothetical protein
MRCSRSRKMCAHGRCLRRSPTSACRSLNDVRSSLVEARPTCRPPEFRVRTRIRGQGSLNLAAVFRTWRRDEFQSSPLCAPRERWGVGAQSGRSPP